MGDPHGAMMNLFFEQLYDGSYSRAGWVSIMSGEDGHSKDELA